ncbi:uncharacterized protein [Solanum tuberosum]|uniref:uncharacterized protein n=1 Tax=Solanum tuberosum TaxID=4113 RepID=UPI00073A50E6|nr:PREDICTED: uncharacterized protein LOC107060070 [Solanum tuberosum]
MAIVVDNELPEKLSHNHLLYLNSSDTSRVMLISIQLTGSENYSVWSRSMKIAILGRNKLGFIDGKCRKEGFGTNLVDLWERCNAIVLSWIMNSVSKELLSGIVYSTDACGVWRDLKERFDKANGLRIFQLHREIVSLTQGMSSISEYFTRLRLLWAEFDSLAPFSGCDCARSQDFTEFMRRQKLLQFLMGLNESYEQARGQLLMLIPIPSVNQAYSMMIEWESQRNMAHVAGSMTNMEIASLVAGRNGHPKLKKNWNSQCDYCRRTGHTRDNCYKLIGYPPDFKFRKKDNNPNLVNPRGHGRASCVDTYRGSSDRGKGVMPSESHSGGREFGRYSGDWHREAEAGRPNYSHHQYNQLMHNMENPHHYNQFQRLMDKDNSGGSSSHSHLSDSANMGGNVSVSNVLNSHNTSNIHTPQMNEPKEEWIIDTGATNHMISHKGMLIAGKGTVKVSNKMVYLPNGETVDVSHIGNCGIMNGRVLTNVLYIPDFRFNLMSVSRITKELNCSVQFFPNFCIFQDLSNGKVLEIGEEKDGLYLLKRKGQTENNDQHFRGLRQIKGLIATRNKVDVLLWHRRMGHTSAGAMQQVFSLSHDYCKQEISSCEICPLAKQTRIPFPSSDTRSIAIFDLLHLDVWGPFHVPTFDGNKLFLPLWMTILG